MRGSVRVTYTCDHCGRTDTGWAWSDIPDGWFELTYIEAQRHLCKRSCLLDYIRIQLPE